MSTDKSANGLTRQNSGLRSVTNTLGSNTPSHFILWKVELHAAFISHIGNTRDVYRWGGLQYKKDGGARRTF